MSKYNAYPTKTTLNLMIQEHRTGDLRVLLPCTVVGVILLGLFCHYGVVERLTGAFRAEQAAEQAEQALAQAEAELQNYDEVEAEYNRYFSDALFSGDIPQECMDVLAVMEDELMSRAQVTSCSFSKNTLQLRLIMSQLGVTSELLDALKNVPMVDHVSISTATDDSQTPTANHGQSIVILTITLRETEKK